MWRPREPPRARRSMTPWTRSSRSPADRRRSPNALPPGQVSWPGGRRPRSSGGVMAVLGEAAGSRIAVRRGTRRRRTMPGSKAAYGYIAPFFVVFLAFSLYPWLDTAWVSLHNVRLTTYDQQQWVGLANYHNLFTNKFFYNALRNTLTIGIISTVPQLCLALGIAHLLNYKLRGRTFFRVAMLMPYATSLAAATVIFLQLFDKDLGVINWMLHLVNLPTVDWQ